MAGVYYTEFRLDGELRRTVVAHTTTEKREAANRLGRAVLTMVATDVVVDPFPVVEPLSAMPLPGTVPRHEPGRGS